ncbi:hypothetical protein BGV71_19305 [Burkholderia ubonensis]|nr:hypothetical protein BGV71_19305 [Burkholderia ubonensis]
MGLQIPKSERGEPVQVGLTGHQLARAFALALRPAAAPEGPMVEEEAQQLEVWRAQMAAQREVVAQSRVQVLHERTATRRVPHRV